MSAQGGVNASPASVCATLGPKSNSDQIAPTGNAVMHFHLGRKARIQARSASEWIWLLAFPTPSDSLACASGLYIHFFKMHHSVAQPGGPNKRWGYVFSLGPPLWGSTQGDLCYPGLLDVRSARVAPRSSLHARRSTLGWLRDVPSGLEQKQARNIPLDDCRWNTPLLVLVFQHLDRLGVPRCQQAFACPGTIRAKQCDQLIKGTQWGSISDDDGRSGVSGRGHPHGRSAIVLPILFVLLTCATFCDDDDNRSVLR